MLIRVAQFLYIYVPLRAFMKPRLGNCKELNIDIFDFHTGRIHLHKYCDILSYIATCNILMHVFLIFQHTTVENRRVKPSGVFPLYHVTSFRDIIKYKVYQEQIIPVN